MNTVVPKSRLSQQRPPLVLFDVHGVILETSWEFELKTLYNRLVKPLRPAKRRNWINTFFFLSRKERITSLAKLTGKSLPEIEKVADQVRRDIHTHFLPDIKPHIRSFLKALQKQGIPALALCGGRAAHVKGQMRLHNLTTYIPASRIIGLDENPPGTTGKRRALFALLHKCLNRRLIYINDWRDENRFMKSLGGTVIGIADSQAGRYTRCRRLLLDSGADHVFRGWTQWQRILRLVISS